MSGFDKEPIMHGISALPTCPEAPCEEGSANISVIQSYVSSRNGFCPGIKS